MREPRPEKVAVVDEVSARLETGAAVIFSEYRGLDTAALAELRRALRAAGGEHKIYKNTLVRLAAIRQGLAIEHLLTGPTAMTFVTAGDDGTPADPAAVAKALREFARSHAELVLKGGVLDNTVLGPDQLRALAGLAPREVLLAQLAGALAAPMARLAGLLAALPRDFAYGLKALIDQGGPEGARGAADAPDAELADAPDADAADAELADAADAGPADAADAGPAGEPAAEDPDQSNSQDPDKEVEQ